MLAHPTYASAQAYVHNRVSVLIPKAGLSPRREMINLEDIHDHCLSWYCLYLAPRHVLALHDGGELVELGYVVEQGEHDDGQDVRVAVAQLNRENTLESFLGESFCKIILETF